MSLPSITDAVYIELSRHITAFFFYLDTGDIEAAANLFADDTVLDMGVAERPVANNRDGVRKMFGTRPDNRAVRHHWSNLHIVSADDDIAAVFQFATYVGAADIVAPATGVTLGDVEIVCRRVEPDGQWHFLQLKRTVVFAPEQ